MRLQSVYSCVCLSDAHSEGNHMARRNVYVRDEDEEVWERAEKLAGEAPMSRVITEALRAYVRSREGNPMERKVIAYEDPGTGEFLSKAFVGRWLIEPDEEYRSEHEGDDLGSETQVMGGTTFAVGETAKGNIVIWVDARRSSPTYAVHDSFDDAESAGVPADVVALASTRAGFERAELLDI
jgi:hypothetical protein